MAVKRIDVTQEDIDKGCRWIAQACPVWRAVKRHLAPDAGFSTCSTFCCFWLGQQSKPSEVTPSIYHAAPVRSWISLYDYGVTVKPFSFSLDIPDWALAEKRGRGDDEPVRQTTKEDAP